MTSVAISTMARLSRYTFVGRSPHVLIAHDHKATKDNNDEKDFKIKRETCIENYFRDILFWEREFLSL